MRIHISIESDKLVGNLNQFKILEGNLKKKSLIILISIVIGVLLSSCQPSTSAVQTAMAQTQSVLPTSTNTSAPTSTATNTPEPTFTLTATITLTPTSTPDLRIIEVESEEFLLDKYDLPPEGKYYVPNQLWITPDHNDEVIGRMGKVGAAFVKETGRIDGWGIIFNRGRSRVYAPDEVLHYISQFESCEGALIAVQKYAEYKLDNEIELVDNDYDLGDKTVISKYREIQPGGEYLVIYYVETAYRNYVSEVAGAGYEDDFDLDYVIQIAEIALALLEDAPIVDP